MLDQKPTAHPQTIDPAAADFIEGFSAFLVNRHALDELAKHRAQRAQLQSKERFDLVLTRLGLISEADMARHLSEFLGVPLLGAQDLPEVPLLADRLQLQFLASNRIIPVSEDGEALRLAVADPFNADSRAAIAYLLGRPIEYGIMPAGEIESALERLYGRSTAATVDISLGEPETASEEDVRRLEDMASEAPVIRLVHNLITRAVEMRASDIHIEPCADSLRVRYRVDGILSTVETLPLSLRAAVTSRLKIMAHLNIAERRLPQDGRIRSIVRGKDIDVRMSSVPTIFGESVVLRLLDKANIELDFSALGFQGPAHDKFIELLAQPNGIILVTGPTGSGKTTTLYTALKRLNRPESKLFTVEDPIEYQLHGINQIQIQPKIGLTFAHALRSILRQDPDIIMVGEIRDLETAQMAIQASLTGHLVLSTVHTNSAAATVTRLLDMRVEDYLLASTLMGVLAQRLVRRLCGRCSKPAEASSLVLEKVAGRSSDLGGLRARVGCDHCGSTGYSGRTTISELLIINDAVRHQILHGGAESLIQAAAVESGMVSMFDNGLSKVLNGETTIEEVLRVARMS